MKNFGYHPLYLDGQLTDAVSGQRHAVICPGTGETIAHVAWAGREDAERALESAKAGFVRWSALSIGERAQWMARLRTEVVANEVLLREAITCEMGKPFAQTHEDYESLIRALEWYPQEMQHRRDEIIPDIEGTHLHQMVSRPAGVVVAYLAWNFPLLNLAFKIGPALAAGCSLIVKPSANSPLSCYLVASLAAKIGFPAGVFNVLTGPNDTVSLALSSSVIPRVITMIGSSRSGMRAIQESASSIKRYSMELGGNAPAIVFGDADLQQAVNLIAAVKYGNCGQICVAPNRIFVHESIYESFVQAFVEKVKSLKLGFGWQQEHDVGPLADAGSQQRMVRLAKEAIEDGARLECGGRIPATPGCGWFFEPTVFSGVEPRMRLFPEEIFGPLASILSFRTEAEVIEMANDCDVGLSSYLFTHDLNRMHRVSAALETGEVHVNGLKYAIYLPHGGVKNSGLGHDCSHLALDTYLERKRITVTLQ
jgi:succinate-semialdehyde dehydrogenase / glutarate-semialdehyde dehydrogenase